MDVPDMEEFPKRFDYQEQEPKLYKQWLDSGAFLPDTTKSSEPRSILMPPPNANAPLHVGHAYEVAIQDALIRYWRLKGHPTLWQPGMDHAGFETQIVFERKLEKEGRTRFGMARAVLYQEIFEYTKAQQTTIRQQFERLGASADWSRFRFMLDEPLINTVYKTFKELYEDGLIYQGERPVNWCVKHQTTLSDLETRYEEREDTFYYFHYGPFVIGTARPETKFGDKYVVMHPDDPRYKDYTHGQQLTVEWINGPIVATILKDSAVDQEFGTGVMTITPWHDPLDFEIAQRHNLEIEQVIDFKGRLLPIAGEFADMKIAEARPKIVEKLQAKGLVVTEKVDHAYRHNVQVCYKCGSVIEPQIMKQWWLALTKPSKKHDQSLRDMALAAVKSGETRFVAERFENQFYSWMNSLRDWPLSRQIVWGIQLPVWYAADGSVIVTDGSEPENVAELTRDSDVFDTWFSSCQWPFSTLGNHDDDLETFYPTTAMCPGYDILFFWVARMMMLSIYTQGKSPYKVINMHGMVRDKDRQKMSKSKGNVVNPLAVVEEYGADALRLALLYGAAPGTDPTISEEKIRGMRNFTTKIWNIARYVMLQAQDVSDVSFSPVTDADKAIVTKLNDTIEKVTDAMETYNLHIALETLYQFAWHDVADVYLEVTKTQIENPETKVTTQGNLRYIIDTLLRLLHPFAPFVTEGLWQEINPDQKPLIIQAWPTSNQ